MTALDRKPRLYGRTPWGRKFIIHPSLILSLLGH